MVSYNVYEQKRPLADGKEFRANLHFKGRVDAIDIVVAMRIARVTTQWPMLHELRVGKEI